MESWIDSYFELIAKIKSREGLALKRSNFPEALYRYRSLGDLAYRLEELRDGYVFLSNPADFNDPYDSALSTSYAEVQRQAAEKILPQYGLDPNTVSEFLESLGEKEKEEWLTQQQQAYESVVRGLLSVVYGPRSFPEDQDLFSSFRKLVHVSCFTTNPNSVVMWSHYANQHKGICVEFSSSSMLSSTKFLELLHPVRYTEELFHFFSFFQPETAVDQDPPPSATEVNIDPWPILAACHKSKEWEYEKEWRLVSLDQSSGPKFSLVSCGVKPSRIILGARIDGPNQAAITELAEKISVPVVKARLAKDRFKIEF